MTKLTKLASALAVACGISLSGSAIAVQQADLMITNGTVLTMNPGREVIENGTVVVKDNKIVAVGDAALARNYEVGKRWMWTVISSCPASSIPIPTCP